MGVKMATTCLHWSQPIVHHCPSSSLAPSIPSSSSKRRTTRNDLVGALLCHQGPKFNQSALFGAKIYWSKSYQFPKTNPKIHTITRSHSTSLDNNEFSDEEFSKKIQELALKFQQDAETSSLLSPSDNMFVGSADDQINNTNNKLLFPIEPPWQELQEWPSSRETDEIIPASIERKANSVDLPLSLRIIKRKKQWQDGFKEVGESAYCSVKKAFSSMVFIIQELHSYTLQMRELLFYQDVQGILTRVQKEMHASFVWLFQQVFAPTPTLMVYVMILLANFTVYSMGNNYAIAAPPPQTSSYAASTTTESVSQFDSSTIRRFSINNSGGKTASIDGNSGGGGGKFRPVASGTDGGDMFDRSKGHGTMLPDGVSSQLTNNINNRGEVSEVVGEEEVRLWNSIVGEASRMSSGGEGIDPDVMQKFVSPVTAKVEDDDYADYLRTELLYQTGLAHEPTNALLLANYAQFLYLVARDYDRAEDYFKKATAVEPPDAEAYNKYATFLWMVRKDLWAAEETYLQAISADPANTFYAANYAHFLWNTGGEDTCFPANTSPNTNTHDT